MGGHGGAAGGSGGGAGGGGGGNVDGGSACNLTTPCPSGETCISGGTCAKSCAPDGGAAACPSGTTCQGTSGFCVGTGCAAIQVFVCLPGSTSGTMTCNPACGSGSVCVGTGTSGGAIIVANDAGVCPPGTHPTGFENRCDNDLGYACQPIPAGCNGTVTCACASSLCASLHTCQSASNSGVTCLELVP
jgi:hypothetical protein